MYVYIQILIRLADADRTLLEREVDLLSLQRPAAFAYTPAVSLPSSPVASAHTLLPSPPLLFPPHNTDSTVEPTITESTGGSPPTTAEPATDVEKKENGVEKRESVVHTYLSASSVCRKKRAQFLEQCHQIIESYPEVYLDALQFDDTDGDCERTSMASPTAVYDNNSGFGGVGSQTPKQSSTLPRSSSIGKGNLLRSANGDCYQVPFPSPSPVGKSAPSSSTSTKTAVAAAAAAAALTATSPHKTKPDLSIDCGDDVDIPQVNYTGLHRKNITAGVEGYIDPLTMDPRIYPTTEVRIPMINICYIHMCFLIWMCVTLVLCLLNYTSYYHIFLILISPLLYPRNGPLQSCSHVSHPLKYTRSLTYY